MECLGKINQVMQNSGINFHVSLLKDGISRMVLRGADMDDVDF